MIIYSCEEENLLQLHRFSVHGPQDARRQRNVCLGLLALHARSQRHNLETPYELSLPNFFPDPYTDSHSSVTNIKGHFVITIPLHQLE